MIAWLRRRLTEIGRATMALVRPSRAPDHTRAVRGGMLLTLVLLALLIPVGALVVLFSGIMPITASSGHWPITVWFLQTGKRRSVALHSWTIAPPKDFNTPENILKGAGHYDIGCRSCHASPGEQRPPIPLAMTPAPPRLADLVETWDAAELFYIVKHGIKFTGMPAWPTQHRDDEVWAVVAFLQQLPHLTPAEYERLARGDPALDPPPPSTSDPPREVGPFLALVRSCTPCHGPQGIARGTGAFPHLAGQSERYLAASLDAYASGARRSGIMQSIAAGLDPNERQALARFYAALPPPASQPNASDRLAHPIGREIAQQGVPLERIASCIDCHTIDATPRNPHFPILASQPAPYLELQLKLLHAKRRGGTPFVDLMHSVAPRLSDDQIRAVAQYFAARPHPAHAQPLQAAAPPP